MLTLASDFGSPYPAAMKGVLLQRTDARLVDVAHDFPRQDVRAAAFWLQEVLPYFPPAVHLVVVDPGVGTDRDALVVRAGDHALVGPDNGVLFPSARVLTDHKDVAAFVVDPDAPALEAPDTDAVRSRGESRTFHGRDVFAPAAAAVHEAGVDAIEDLPGVTPSDDPTDLRLPAPAIDDEGATGEVLVVDDFGNAITNLPGDLLAGREAVSVDGRGVPVVDTFAAVDPGQRLVTVGSHGNVELDVNRGRGDEAFGLAAGDRVRIEW